MIIMSQGELALKKMFFGIVYIFRMNVCLEIFNIIYSYIQS